MVAVNFPIVRLGLYFVLGIWTVILFCLCCARLNYTNRLGTEIAVFSGVYDPSVAELLVASIFALIWVPSIVYLIRKRSQHPILARAWFEISILSVLWLFWVSGAGAVTNVFPILSECSFSQCKLVQAIQAFAWLGWITITALLGGTMFFTIKNNAWLDDVYDTWRLEKRVES
ncbi:hypothetical protein FRB99_007841 [Tulasnella sp. 403]|nr:hypothetical protein FRB99_007841 [Tulasnella sp. 403]